MSEFDIVVFAKALKKEYVKRGNDLSYLKQELESKNFSFNDYAVIRCGFEQDLEATFLINGMETKLLATEFFDNFHVSNSTCHYVFLNDLKLAEQLDRYFKSDRFVNQTFEIWKNVFGASWEGIRIKAKKHCDAYPTLYSEIMNRL